MAKRISDDANEEEIWSMIASLFVESVFDNCKNIEENELANENVFVESEDDPPESINKELQQRIMGARKAGLSNEGERILKDIIEEHKSISRIPLEKRGPARVLPMKVDLDLPKRPMEVKRAPISKNAKRFYGIVYDPACLSGLC